VAPKKGEARASSCAELSARLAYPGVSAIVGWRQPLGAADHG